MHYTGFLCHYFSPFTSLVYLMLLFLLPFICHVEKREKISLHRAFSREFLIKVKSISLILFHLTFPWICVATQMATYDVTVWYYICIECFAHLLTEKKNFSSLHFQCMYVCDEVPKFSYEQSKHFKLHYQERHCRIQFKFYILMLTLMLKKRKES